MKRMKRWLKKHGKWCLVSLGIIFIANSVLGLISSHEDWEILCYIATIIIWLVIMLLISGAMTKFFDWWEKE